MASVTQRINQIKQPRGGFIKPSEFEAISFDDKKSLGEENIHSSLIGLSVDYLTRFMLGASAEDAFRISIIGSMLIEQTEKAIDLAIGIKGLDDDSIRNACKLVGYDVCYRAGPMGFKDTDQINPDKTTINNIRVMVKRSLLFFGEYGPITKDGFTFEGGYTDTINSGDGDFLTSDTLWDFKVSKHEPTSSHTLQLLIYYIMGKHSKYKEFDSIKRLGIFNPRLNKVYLYNIDKIDVSTIDVVSRDIIGYEDERTSEHEEQESQEEAYNPPEVVYTVTDLTALLHCSRYAVMKYFSEYGLPLYKKGSKYYISGKDLTNWQEMMRERKAAQESEQGIAMLVILIFIIFALIAFFALLSPR